MKRILVIEDEQAYRDLLKEKLTKEGYDTVIAIDGKTGMAEINQYKPDLILLDIMLPGGMNGFDVLETMKRNPATRSIPVIVITNLDTEKKTALDIGAQDYIVKADSSIKDILSKVNGIFETMTKKGVQ